MPGRHRRGFTLLEVMAAMAILATAMVILLENHASSIRLTERSRNVSLAINLAKDLMTDLETMGFPELGTAAGDFELLYPGLYPDFRWEQEVTENNFWSYVRECYVRVYWRDGVQEQKIELTQYIAALDQEQQQIAEEESETDDDTSGGAAKATGEGGGGLLGGLTGGGGKAE